MEVEYIGRDIGVDGLLNNPIYEVVGIDPNKGG